MIGGHSRRRRASTVTISSQLRQNSQPTHKDHEGAVPSADSVTALLIGVLCTRLSSMAKSAARNGALGSIDSAPPGRHRGIQAFQPTAASAPPRPLSRISSTQ